MVSKRYFAVAIIVVAIGFNEARAQLLHPPLVPLTTARVAQTPAPTGPRLIQFANEEGVTTSFVTAPAVATTLEAGSTPSGDAAQWLKVEFHYSVNPDKTPFIDAAEFKVWIEGRDLYSASAPPGNQGVAVCLTGAVSYVNLPKARDAYAVFFVHPNALARYSGAGGTEDFDRKFNVHVEAYVNGTLVDYDDKRKDAPDWWKAPIQVAGMVMRQVDSPFALDDVGRYPQTKLEQKQ